MHQLAIGSLQSNTGVGGIISGVVAVVFILWRVGMMYGRARRGTGVRRWPGGGFGYGAGPGQHGEPDSPAAPRDEVAGEHLGQRQDDSYWEPGQEDGTLSADGYIGDPGETASPADSG